MLDISDCESRKHLERLDLTDTAYCECSSEEQTPDYISQPCPLLGTSNIGLKKLKLKPSCKGHVAKQKWRVNLVEGA